MKFDKLFTSALEEKEDEPVKDKPKNKGGRPRGPSKNKKLAKDVRDKILGRFRIDEFLDLVDKDPLVRRFYYLKLVPSLLPKITEQDATEPLRVFFGFDTDQDKPNKKKRPIEIPLRPAEEKKEETPLKLTFSTPPKIMGM